MCFQSINISFSDRARCLVAMPELARRIVYHKMLPFDGSFYFDGKTVCSPFLKKAFHISLDLKNNSQQNIQFVNKRRIQNKWITIA